LLFYGVLMHFEYVIHRYFYNIYIYPSIHWRLSHLENMERPRLCRALAGAESLWSATGPAEGLIHWEIFRVQLIGGTFFGPKFLGISLKRPKKQAFKKWWIWWVPPINGILKISHWFIGSFLSHGGSPVVTVVVSILNHGHPGLGAFRGYLDRLETPYGNITDRIYTLW